MRKQSLVCDRCGEPATEWVRVTEHAYYNQMRLDAHNLRDLDLCPKCASELGAWMEVKPSGVN